MIELSIISGGIIGIICIASLIIGIISAIRDEINDIH